MSANNDKLRALLEEILLIEDSQYNDDYGPEEIETWDSLATINIANAVEKEFGYSMSPEEIVSLETIGDIKTILISKGIEI
jgi:acyl carrier protein